MYIIGPIGVVVKILTWIFSMIFGSRVKADGSVDRRFGSGLKTKILFKEILIISNPKPK